jgi:hypothetical protein
MGLFLQLKHLFLIPVLFKMLPKRIYTKPLVTPASAAQCYKVDGLPRLAVNFLLQQ